MEALKTGGEAEPSVFNTSLGNLRIALDFQHFTRDPANNPRSRSSTLPSGPCNELKIMFDPSIENQQHTYRLLYLHMTPIGSDSETDFLECFIRCCERDLKPQILTCL